MQDWYQRLQFDRLIVLSAIATAGVLLTLRATMPLLAIAVVVLLGVVTAALRQVVSARGDDSGWMVAPLLLTLASSLFWRAIPDERATLIGSALFGIFFLFTIVDYHQNRFGLATRFATWPNQAIVYITLFMLFATLSSWGLHVALHSALVAITAFAASISILFREGLPRAATQTYSLLIALVAGEVTWALIYWPLPMFQEALALLLHTHVVLGLARAHHAKKLGFAAVFEFGTVGAITAALLLWTTLSPLG